MADKYAIPAGGNWSAAGTWALTDGGAGGAGAPSASENAFFSNQSGNVVVDVIATCLDLDFTKGTGYTGTLSGSIEIDVSGNLVANGAMTWTHTGGLVFKATAGTKTIKSNGVALNVALFDISGSGGTFQLLDNLTLQRNNMTFRKTAGTFDANGKTVSLTGAGTPTIDGGPTFFNLTRPGTASKTDVLRLQSDITVTGTLTLTGNSVVNRLLLFAITIGAQRTATCSNPPVLTNCDFQDIASAGAGGTWSGASMGDCGGNSGITFDAPVTQTATGTASFTWSTHGWTTRVPLPQDNVLVPNAFAASQTITADMPRLGKNITFSCTGSPAFTPNTPSTIFGSLTLAAGMTNGSNQAMNLNGRSSHTLTCAGCSFTMPTFINAGGTYGLQDAWSCTSTNSLPLRINFGTLNTNDFSVTLGGATTASGFQLNGASATVNMGASVFSIATTDAWSYSSGTVNAGTSTIKLTNASASAKSFAGGGKTYYNVWFNNAGAGALQVTGSNTFNDFRSDSGRTIQFTAGTTTTANSFTWDGCTIGSITAASHTLAKSGAGQAIAQTVNVSRSTATPGTTFYALNASTDGGNNSGWTFGAGKLIADAAAFSMAASPATMRATRRMPAAAGAFALTGNAADLRAFQLFEDPRYIMPADGRRFAATKDLHA